MTSKDKILLINPPLSLEERYGKELKHFGGHAEPLGLAYVAAAVRQDGCDVEIIDSPVQNYTAEMIAEKIKCENTRIVGITMLTPMYGQVKKTVAAIKNISPGTFIVIGGAHGTALPEETLTDIKNDIVVIGEGENTFRELVKAINNDNDLKEVEGICYNENGKPVRTAPRKVERNIDNFPPPARDLLPMEKYFLTATRVNKTGFCGTVTIARGCPFHCSYCSHPFGYTFRAHSPERILAEIEELICKYKATQINFEADALTVSRKFILSLCNTIIESNMHKKIKWTCESRADALDEMVLSKMKEAGCWQISIGVESGVDRLLKEINKGETTQEIEDKIKLIKKAGISVRAFFMLGLPSETAEESLQTIKFAKKLDPDWAQFTITTPYPGTPMFESLKEKQEINSYNWDDYKTWGGWTEGNIPYITKGRTLKELKHLQKYAMKSFYLRPRVFIRFLSSINSWQAFKKYWIGFLILIKLKNQKG